MKYIQPVKIPKIKVLGLNNTGISDEKDLTGGTNFQNVICKCRNHTKAKNTKSLFKKVKIKKSKG